MKRKKIVWNQPMERNNLQFQFASFFCYVVIQLPLVNKFVFLDSAFGFFYLGFLIFLPLGMNPFLRIFSGFIIGLIIDIFSNTPGLHAMAATLIMFSKDWWFAITMGENEEDRGLSVFTLGVKGIVLFLFPLILTYMLIVFFIEHGKIEAFLMVFTRAFNSTVFTLIIILIINFIIVKRPKRL